MFKKHSINSRTIQKASYAVTAILILLINFFITYILLRKTNAMTEKIYFDSCQNIADGYAESVASTIEIYKTALDGIFYEDYFKTLDTKGMLNFLKKYSLKFHEDFKSVYYVDSSGKAYFTNDITIDVSDRDIYKEIILNGKEEFLNKPVIARNPTTKEDENSYIVIYGRAVKDKNNKTKGVLCASIKLSSLTKEVDSIHIGSDGHVVIQDIEGRFITHPDHTRLNQYYNAANLNFQEVAQEEEGTVHQVIKTKNLNNEDIYFFYRHIQKTDWILIVYMKEASFLKIKSTQRTYQILILLISGIVILLVTITEMIISRKLLKNLLVSTTIDPLTGLRIRDYFDREANKLLLKNRNSKFMVIDADIRRFKIFNETIGIAKANRIIIHFSKIINTFSNKYSAMICRGYADHFYILVKVHSVRTAMAQFQKDLTDITQQLNSYEIPYKAIFGISFYLPGATEHKVSIQKLIGQAKVAKESIKNDALKTYALFNQSLFTKTKNENYIETHMDKALAEKEFFVLYQPKIDLTTDKIIGAEALVRWTNPQLGFMSPAAFIPLFEKNNFITKLDFYVYEQVFAFIRKCLDAGMNIVPVSVNMSRNHTKPEKFIHDFISLLKKYDIPPQLIEVELIERSAMDKNLLREFTVMLHNEGLTVAMDDFGSGESSLNMLTNIPVDVIKFDRSFLLTEDMKNGEITAEKAKFIQTLITLGKNLKKQTLFEGVETEEQRDFLKSIHCDYVQGYFYSKPLKEEEFIEFIKNHS